MKGKPRPWAVDLFCGAGGLSLGLEEEGFAVVAAADSDPVSIETHAANIEGLTWTGDLSNPIAFIDQLASWGIESVDILAGGPPCQPFSSAGISKIGNLVKNGRRRARDERADLWRSFFAIADHLEPSAIVMENVPNFAHAQGGMLLVALVDELKSRGYEASVDVIDAWKYRVPQHRSRLFVVGLAGGRQFEWPNPTGNFTTVGQAIEDLPAVGANSRIEVLEYPSQPKSEFAKLLRKGLCRSESKRVRDHITRAVREDDAEIYSILKPGGTYMDVPERLRRYRSDIFKDKYLRLSFDGLSRTITAHIAKDGYWYIHPSEDRTLSIREAARIQTFPDRFRFAGHPTNRYRQIGNAVPPLLASAMARSLRIALQQSMGTRTTGNADRPFDENFRKDLVAWFKREQRCRTRRRSHLNPWQILLLEICLHQTNAEQIDLVADELLEFGSTPEALLRNFSNPNSTIGILASSGNYEDLLSAARFVVENHGGDVPDNWQELNAIPGVNDNVASAALCFGFNRQSVLFDTDTRRITRRVLGNSYKSTWQLRLALRQLADEDGPDVEWNQALLDLGALICTARAPKCGECPVRRHCAMGRTKMNSGSEVF